MCFIEMHKDYSVVSLSIFLITAKYHALFFWDKYMCVHVSVYFSNLYRTNPVV